MSFFISVHSWPNWLCLVTLVSGYRSRDPLNRLTQHELGGLQDFSI
jgi:hypothetical protein